MRRGRGGLPRSGAPLLAALRPLADAWAKRGNARPHGLPAPLVVSLTSYPPRFGTLEWTLRSLLSQSLRPDRVELWLADGDRADLPAGVRLLVRHGLAICRAADLRSYKKILPALGAHPSAFIVTADDDVCYQPDWLAGLVEGFEAMDEVLSRRTHLMKLGDDGLPVAYADWERDVVEATASPLLFPTGVGGVLYPPGIFDQRVRDAASALTLCPTGDDIWLYFMARLNGARMRNIAGRFPLVHWPGSQMVNLWESNIGEGLNDIQIGRMIERFGFPRP